MREKTDCCQWAGKTGAPLNWSLGTAQTAEIGTKQLSRSTENQNLTAPLCHAAKPGQESPVSSLQVRDTFWHLPGC